MCRLSRRWGPPAIGVASVMRARRNSLSDYAVQQYAMRHTGRTGRLGTRNFCGKNSRGFGSAAPTLLSFRHPHASAVSNQCESGR